MANSVPLETHTVSMPLPGGANAIPSFPAVLDGEPQQDLRVFVDSGLSCCLFDYETLKRGTLHVDPYRMMFISVNSEGRFDLNQAELLPAAADGEAPLVWAETVKIKSTAGGEEWIVHGQGMVPLIVEGERCATWAYLVDMPKGPGAVQGCVNPKFLKDNLLKLTTTTDGGQKMEHL
ncbi:hypothetical protein EDD11_006258 [Mortierella claussenii]|nr:hypothetical protein EDD11_006258 [Mortierella claussenii]